MVAGRGRQVNRLGLFSLEVDAVCFIIWKIVLSPFPSKIPNRGDRIFFRVSLRKIILSPNLKNKSVPIFLVYCQLTVPDIVNH